VKILLVATLLSVAPLSVPPLSVAPLPGSPEPAAALPLLPPARPAADTLPPVRIFLVSDVHSRHGRLRRFVEIANRERPDLVLDAGDFVHDGTEAEFRRARAGRERLRMPWYVVRGNHDARLRGPFAAPPPELPPFRAVEHAELRVILLDNHRERLSDEQFRQLERELAAHAGRRTVVVMHVPPFLSREPAALRIRHALPFPLASPVMREPEQVERFTALMERHGVLAVLTGHSHFADSQLRGGVHYIVAGAAGGLTPGLGIPNEYVDITLEGWEVRFTRVRLGDPAGDPVTFLARAFRFYAELNRFVHREQGWSHVPSASVQLRGGVRRTEDGADAGRDDLAVHGAASWERVLGGAGRQAFVADLGMSAGEREVLGHLAGGFKLRPVGDFNRNLYVVAGASGNAGGRAGRATAGVGVQLGVGAEWHALTLELTGGRATNQRGAALVAGFRF
jgi:predicted phosphodiesterase